MNMAWVDNIKASISKYYFFIFIIILPSCSFKNPAGFFEDQQKELEKEIAKNANKNSGIKMLINQC